MENEMENDDRLVDAALAGEFPRIAERWARDAAAYREAAGARAQLDVGYGQRPRQRLDVFEPGSGAGGPVVMFIHGGFWQFMDRSAFSHLARGANARGLSVAIAGYTLCPEATVAEILDELRSAVAFLAKRYGKPVTVYGHSAGGHLTACLLATDFGAFDSSLGAGVVPAGLSISGLFDLEPLIDSSFNQGLRLDAAEARRLSPLFWPAPAGKSMRSWVGAEETPEFRRQTRVLVEHWRAAGVHIEGAELAGASHFAVLDPLTDPASAITHDLVKLASGPAAPRRATD
jgi:arylformamidase